MTHHGKRILTVSLTMDQVRALRSAARVARSRAALYRDQSLPSLARAMGAIEAAWETSQPDYGEEYRRAHSPSSEARGVR